MNDNHSNIHQEETPMFREYINLIKRNFILIFFISIIGLGAAIYYAINHPDIYKSTTVLKIAKPPGSILNSPVMPEYQDFGSDRFIANEIVILKSRELRERVANSLIDTFKVSNNKKRFSVIVDYLEGGKSSEPILLGAKKIIDLLPSYISIDKKGGVDIVEISAESTSPYEASLIVNMYAAAYKEINLSYNRQTLTAIKEFLDAQKEEKSYQLGLVEENLKNYQEQKGIIQLDEQARALIDQISDVETKLNAAKIDVTITLKTLNQYKEELSKQDPDIKDYIESFATEPYIKNLQLQIADLQSQKDRALVSTTTNVRKDEMIKEFNAKINDLKEKLNNQLSVYRAGILASSPLEIKELTKKVLEEEIKYQSHQASYIKLSEIVRGYERKLNQLPKSSIDVARLQREKNSNEKIYTMIEEKYQEAVINEQSQPGNVLIIDRGLIPDKPEKPNRILIVLIGLALGVSLGFGIAILRRYFDNTIKTPEDIQNRNIAVLAFIPKIKDIKKGNTYSEFIVVNKPEDKASEAFRTLRTRIKFLRVDDGAIKAILVTSPIAQEGKTFSTVNIGGSFARDNSKTILIDADLRKPRIHNMFNDKRVPGLTDYLFGQASFTDVLKKSRVNNLFYITSGKILSSPSEIVGSIQMKNLLEKLRNEYDYIIIDSPPLIPVTDAELLARYADATLLIVKANFTEIELVEKAVEVLKYDKSNFIGTVFNNFSYRNGYGSYYKYYHYYYGTREKKTY
jgi:tyrosine-protein kinase Etk/Wzc